MRRHGERGFSLIEAAVAIAIMAILAGAAAPLILKSLNQQREQKTRDGLKLAYEAMFGSRDHRVSNMRADFGYNPPMAQIQNLRFMTNRTAPWSGGVPGAYGPTAAGFNAGWNGPYWTGSVQAAAGLPGGIPVDAWGRAFRVMPVNGGWQVQSPGVDGIFGTADDLVYPQTTITPIGLSSLLTVNVYNKSPNIIASITLQIQSPFQANPPIALSQRRAQPGANVPLGGNVFNNLPANSSPPFTTLYTFAQAWIGTIVPGPIRVTVTRTTSPLSTQVTPITMMLDLNPNETRTIDLAILD